MKAGKLVQSLIIVALIALALSGAAAGAPSAPGGRNEIKSLQKSHVFFNPDYSQDTCPIPDADQTFCLVGVSFTDDNDWAFYLWVRFPAGWTIHDVHVSSAHFAPFCLFGGTFGDFSWSPVGPNEVRIGHNRLHADPADECYAAYCFQVTPGPDTPGADYAAVSWYWTGSGVGDPPYYPCSSDGYTPPGQPACDQATVPPAYIPFCPRCYLPYVSKD